MTVVLLKLFLAPLLVVASTLAGRRWGPDAAGIVVGLPVVAGPILFIIYLQHGPEFASDAASSSLLGLVSLAAFAVVYSRAASRLGWLAALATSWAAVLAVDAALSFVHLTAVVGLLMTLVTTSVAIILMPTSELECRDEPTLPSSPSWDLPCRAVATGLLVLAVTTASSVLGPHWTGLLAPFPIAISIVTVFAHAQHGPVTATRTLAGALAGLISFSMFCLSVAVLIRHIGGVAFLLSAVVTVVVQLLVLRVRRVMVHR